MYFCIITSFTVSHRYKHRIFRHIKLGNERLITTSMLCSFTVLLIIIMVMLSNYLLKLLNAAEYSLPTIAAPILSLEESELMVMLVLTLLN